ncbi:MAG: DUF1385 domain-containing protein, partial [Cohnella sp.]|nr:DUF1385 domain-containing protein [Cohnella sp.]
MSQQPTSIYGGQAVIEGVMFAGKHVHVTAVRRKDQQITFFEVPKKPQRILPKLKRIPFLRGVIGIVESAAKGSQHLTYSAEAYAEDEPAPEQTSETKPKERWNLTMILGVALVGVLSFVVGKLIFTLVPTFLESMIFGQAFENKILHNLLEGAIKIVF